MFYVTIIRNGDWRPLAGPYETHQDALSKVDHFRKLACDTDPRAIFDAFGTCRVNQTENLPHGIFTPKGVDKLF